MRSTGPRLAEASASSARRQSTDSNTRMGACRASTDPVWCERGPYAATSPSNRAGQCDHEPLQCRHRCRRRLQPIGRLTARGRAPTEQPGRTRRANRRSAARACSSLLGQLAACLQKGCSDSHQVIFLLHCLVTLSAPAGLLHHCVHIVGICIGRFTLVVVSAAAEQSTLLSSGAAGGCGSERSAGHGRRGGTSGGRDTPSPTCLAATGATRGRRHEERAQRGARRCRGACCGVRSGVTRHRLRNGRRARQSRDGVERTLESTSGLGSVEGSLAPWCGAEIRPKRVAGHRP